jgi:hypothetical protein
MGDAKAVRRLHRTQRNERVLLVLMNIMCAFWEWSDAGAVTWFLVLCIVLAGVWAWLAGTSQLDMDSVQ